MRHPIPDRGNITSRKWTLLLVIAVSLVSLPAAHGGLNGLSYTWAIGSDEDLDPTAPAHFSDESRIGDLGTDGETKYRELKPKVYQLNWILPAFDINPDLYGAINHPFFLTIHFKDVSTVPVKMMGKKGGAGFYGQGWIGTLGGAGDGQWKDQTLVIPESMLRSVDGSTFGFAARDIKDAVPISSMTLFSAAATDIPDKDLKIAAAIADDTARRNASIAAIKKKFKELPLPAPDTAVPVTAEETAAGYRLFFPPNARQLFGNSEPRPEDLATSQSWYSTPGQTQYVTIAIRGLKDLGRASIKLGEFKGAGDLALSDVHVRWAQYRDFRVGSSWATTYRQMPNQLVEQDGQDVTPDRLAISGITFTVPDSAVPGDYHGTIEFAAERGQPRSVPITLTVYPFKLEHPDHATHSEFYYTDYGAFDPLELLDMRYHGIDGLVTGMTPQSNGKNPDGTYSDEKEIMDGYTLLKKLGYRAPIVCNLGRQYLLNSDSPDNEKTYREMVRITKELSDKAGFASTEFPIDEPHTKELIAKAALACKWIKEVPETRTYITSNPDAVNALGSLLDDVSYNLSYLNPKTIDGVHAAGQALMFYSGSCDIVPGRVRYRVGYYFAKLNPVNSQYFAYFENADDPLNDLDSGNRDWTSNFPSMNSPFHDTTLGWESFREGVNDYQYVYTLQAMADRATKAGHADAANKALAVVDSVLSQVSPLGSKAGGPELAVEGDTRLKNVKVNTDVTQTQDASWYDDSRKRIAQAIVDLQAQTK